MNKCILIVCPSDKLGGAEQFLLNVAKEYIRNGYQVEVFFLLSQTNNLWSNIEGLDVIYTQNSRELLGLFSLLKIFLKRRKRYELVFSSHQHINSLLSLLRKLKILNTNKLIVRESTSVYLRFKKPHLYYYLLLYYFYDRRSIDLLICQSNEMKQQLLDGNKKFSTFNLKVILNPIDLENVAKKASEGLDIDKPFILAIGRLHSVKGFDNLIKAYKISNAFPNYNLIILGDGPELFNLKCLIQELSLGNKVKLYGHTDNVYPFIQQATLGVISSHLEGFPNVLLQMYALNLKVVSTNCCGGLFEFPNLFLASSKDPQSIAHEINSALSKNIIINNNEFMCKFDLAAFPNKISKLL